MSSSVSLSIVGVYLPTANNSLNLYKEWVQELENLMYALQTDGPVLVMGDIDLMNCTGHFAISLSDLAKGPMYTYFSGKNSTTVDYCLIDCWAAHLVTRCMFRSYKIG